MQWMPEIL